MKAWFTQSPLNSWCWDVSVGLQRVGNFPVNFPEVFHGKLTLWIWGILPKFIKKKKLAENSEPFLWETHGNSRSCSIFWLNYPQFNGIATLSIHSAVHSSITYTADSHEMLLTPHYFTVWAKDYMLSGKFGLQYWVGWIYFIWHTWFLLTSK